MAIRNSSDSSYTESFRCKLRTAYSILQNPTRTETGFEMARMLEGSTRDWYEVIEAMMR